MRIAGTVHRALAALGLLALWLLAGVPLRDASAAAPAAAAAQSVGGARVALVIGNGGYRNAPLANPLNDARAMADSLRRMGFKVASLENASLREMSEAVRQFGDALQGGVGLFYYAGHGVQVKGRNFLVPVDADIQREDEVPYKAFDVSQVLAKMEAAKNPLNIVILDACRNNPFVRASRGAGGGLAQMDAPVGSIVAFATAPGAEAADGAAGNGLYTSQLLRYMNTPGLKVEDVFKRTRVAVKQASAGRQIPWESTSLEGDFFFEPGASGASAGARGSDLDEELWGLVASTGQPSAYRAYLERFPEGKHASEARSLATRPDAEAGRTAIADAGAARNSGQSGGGFSFSAEESKMDQATPEGREREFLQSAATLACAPARRNARVRLALDEPRGGAFAASLAQRLRQAGMRVGATGDYLVRGTVSVQARPHRLLRVNEVVVNTSVALTSAGGGQLASSLLRNESYAGGDVDATIGDLMRAQASQAALQLLAQFCQP